MSLVSNPIDALFNGVSQQPANMRLPSQCEEQINGYSSVADGLSKRPPTEFLAKMSASQYADAFIHIINRDTTERYAVVVTDGALEVFDLSDGVGKTVVYEAASTYLDLPVGATAKESFAVVSVADYSFIVNKRVVVGTYAAGTGQHANWNKWYFPDNWKKSGEETRYYMPTVGTDKGKVQTLADLPDEDAEAPDVPPSQGDFYEIAGTDDSGFSKYYVIYNGGVWQETHEKNEAIQLDEATMPHALVREQDGNFHFRQFGWIPRLFGDQTTNPEPSFVGKTISSLGYHKNRLVLAAGENIIFSGAGDYGNFFRNTVTQLLDSDVVDVAVSTVQVANINHVLPAENNLMFFSDQAQFALNVDQLLTPGTVSVDVATTYEMNKKVAPLAIGPDVFFVTETGNYSHVREYGMSDSDSLETDATDITAHVRKYIPKNVFRLAGSSNDDIMIALSEDAPNTVYVYKYFYSGGEKVQSAWSKWQFADDDEILDASILNNRVYFVVQRADGLYLETMNVQSTSYPLGLEFDILLDQRYQFDVADKVYDGTTYTTFTFPYAIPTADRSKVRLVLGDGATPGRVLDQTQFVWTGTTTVKAPGDWTASAIFGGLVYDFLYTFSRQYQRRRDGQAVTTGRYQLRSVQVVFENMAVFSTVVDPYGNNNATQEDIVAKGLSDFTGKTLGHTSLTLDAPTFDDGEYEFQIYGDSKDAIVQLKNDTPFGGSFVSAVVTGFYTNRGR